MSTTNWHGYRPANEIAKRAGGRRRLNAERHAKALARQVRILELIGARWILPPRGLFSRLATLFGVHRSTITRDIQAINEEWRHTHVCRACGKMYSISLRAHARLYQMQKRHDPSLQPSCCVHGYIRREAERKKKRVSELEQRFRQAVER
jgi:ribosomal protein L37AE/L43A